MEIDIVLPSRLVVALDSGRTWAAMDVAGFKMERLPDGVMPGRIVRDMIILQGGQKTWILLLPSYQLTCTSAIHIATNHSNTSTMNIY